MRLRLICLAFAALVFAGTVACDESLSDVTGPTPNLEPTFSSIQRNIFEGAGVHRACVQCHTSVGRVPPAQLDLTAGVSYARLVGVASIERPLLLRVAAGDPENSYLVHKLEGRPGIGGARMPLGMGPFLTEGQMLVIKRWIALGARND